MALACHLRSLSPVSRGSNMYGVCDCVVTFRGRSAFMYEQPLPGLRVGHHPAGVAWWQRTARERSLLNRGSCCEDEISSAAPDPGGKNYSPGGVNEPRRPRGGGRQPIGCPGAPGTES